MRGESLGARTLRAYKDAIWRTDGAFPTPNYETKAREALQAYLRDRLPEDPQDPSILSALLGEALRRDREDPVSVDPKELTTRWRVSLELDAYLPVTWSIGQEIDAALHGGIRPEQRSMNSENQVYYVNDDSIRPVTHLAALHADHRITIGETRNRFGAQMEREAVRCPMMGASPLFEALSADDPVDWGCQIAWDGPKLLGQVRAIKEEAQDCGWETEATIEELLCAPTPVEVFLAAE